LALNILLRLKIYVKSLLVVLRSGPYVILLSEVALHGLGIASSLAHDKS